MDKSLVEKDMRELIETDASRSKIAQLREVFEYVQEAIDIGVPRAAVLVKLNLRGLDMNMATFETCLRRIRLERASESSLRKSGLPPATHS